MMCESFFLYDQFSPYLHYTNHMTTIANSILVSLLSLQQYFITLIKFLSYIEELLLLQREIVINNTQNLKKSC